MKRDMEVVRAILLAIEAMERVPAPMPELEGIDVPTLGGHCELMIDAGLIEGKALRQFDSYTAIMVRGITWQGYDLLEAMKNDTVWEKIKATITSKGGGWTVDVVVALGKAYLLSRIAGTPPAV